MNRKPVNIVKWLFAMVLLLVFACSKDEFDSPLTGEWEGVSFIASEPVDENGDGEAHTDLLQEIECVSMKAEFTSHGRFSIISTDASYDVQIVNGEVVLIPNGCTGTTETGHWTLNDNSTVLSLEFDIPGKDEPTLVEINIELSATRLVMKDLLFSEDPLITYSVEFEKK